MFGDLLDILKIQGLLNTKFKVQKYLLDILKYRVQIYIHLNVHKLNLSFKNINKLLMIFTMKNYDFLIGKGIHVPSKPIKGSRI